MIISGPTYKPMPLYKRNPMNIRGFAQFKKNMRLMAAVADSDVMVAGFVNIAEEMKSGMDIRLMIKLKPETDKYLRWKESRKKKRKGGSTVDTSLRRKGIVAKKFMSKGKSISFVAINYKYAPHAWWMEHGTTGRWTKTGAYKGRIFAKKYEYFDPTVKQWRGGRYQKRG